MDGFEAVRLWHCYRRGDRQALRKLILYNLTDVVNLVELMEIAGQHKGRRLAAFPGDLTTGKTVAATKPVSEYLADWALQYIRTG